MQLPVGGLGSMQNAAGQVGGVVVEGLVTVVVCVFSFGWEAR